MSIQILCANDEKLIVDPTSLTNVPPVLARLLGLREGFAPPEVDENGYMTFLKKFSIERNDFVDCLIFLRTGHIRRIGNLMNTFNILGGCNAFDAKCEQIRQENKAVEMKQTEEAEKRIRMKQENPLTPEENDLGLFRFELHSPSWNHDGTWEVTSAIDHMLWWRKRVQKSQKNTISGNGYRNNM